MHRYFRYLLKGFGILILLFCFVFGLAIFLLYHKQEKWVQLALSGYNAQIEGEISLVSSKVSPFANFPYISIDLHGLRAHEQKNDTLPMIAIGDVYVGFDLIKIIKGEMQIAKVKIVDGYVNLILSNDSTYKPFQAFMIPSERVREEDREMLSKELKLMELQNIKVRKSNTFDSAHYEVHVERLKAGFRKTPQDLFIDLDTDFVLSLATKETVLAQEKPISIQTVLEYSLEEQKIHFSPSDLYIQGVLFSFNGSVDISNDLDLNFQIGGLKQDFSLFFALLPDDFADFAQRYQNAGNIYFDASVIGKAAQGFIPKIQAEFGCQNGFFHNTVVDRKVDQLSFKGYFSNGEDGTLSSSEFRLLDFNAVPEQGVVKVSLIIQDLLDPYVDLKVFTDFDLQFLADFFELSQLQGLQGQILIDVNYNELVDIDRPETVLVGVQQGIDSRLEVRNLKFQIPGYPIPVDNINMLAIMDDGRFDLDTLSIRMGNSELDLSGFVSNLPDILHKKKESVEIGLNVKSSFIDLYALSNFDSLNKKPIREEIHQFYTTFKFEGLAEDLINFDYLPKGEFTLDDFSLSLKNYPHTFHDFDMHLSITENDLELHKWRGEIDSSDFLLSAKAYNYPKWMRDTTEGRSKVVLSLSADRLFPVDILGPEGVNKLPQDYVNEEIRNLKLNGSLALAYTEGKFQSYDLALEKAQASFLVHQFNLEGISGRIFGDNATLQTEDLNIRIGQSDVNVSMQIHHGQDVQQLPHWIRINAKNLDFDELSNYDFATANAEDNIEVHAQAFNIFELPFSNTSLDLNIAKLKYHKIWIENFKTRLRMTDDHMVFVDQFDMDIAGGHVAFSGYLNGSNPEAIYFSPQMTLQELDLNKILIKVENKGQEFLVNDNIKGILSGKISGSVRLYPDLFPILDESELEMDIMIKNGVMVNYAPLQMLGSFFADRNLNYVRFDTLQNTFTLRNNELITPTMTINSSIGFLEISGRQSLSMDMNYLIRIPWNLVTNVGVQKLFGRRNRDDVPPDQIDEIIMRDTGRRVRFLNVRLTGTPGDFNVALGRGRAHRQTQ